MSLPIYASLVGPFIGKYCVIPGARDHAEARLMCNTDRRMQPLWCSTYSREDVDRMIREYGGEIITIQPLDYDVYVLETHRGATP